MYTYVAASNPSLVKALAHKYGYPLKNNPDLPKVLEQLVGAEGEEALMDIIKNHPEYDLFKDYFSQEANLKAPEPKIGCGGGCAGCNGQKRDAMVGLVGNVSQDAPQFRESKKIVQETSLIVLASAVIIAVAVLAKSK